MATDSLKACQASGFMFGVYRQERRIRSPSLRLEGEVRNPWINRTCCRSGLRGSELVVSIEPMVLVGVMASSIGGKVVDTIRLQNAGMQLGVSKFKKQNSRLRAQNKSFAKASLYFSRDFDVRACATAGPGQTFPSQNGGGEKSLPVKPHPSIEPDQVVQAQLKALREKDLAVVYEFASPTNKSHTGPLPRFTQMLEGKAYNLMIGHVDAKVLSTMTVSPSRFQQRIIITGANGRNATFSWSLSKQEEGAFEGCWMTDTVRRDD